MKIQSTTEQVESYIKEKILAQELQPGDIIKEAELAEQLCLSRSPVREALLHLRAEGLLTYESRRKKCITRLCEKTVMDSYESAGFIEGAVIASTLEHFIDQDIEKLISIACCFLQQEENNLLKNFDVDNMFHDFLLSKTDNQVIKALHKRSCRNISKFLLCHHWQQEFTPQIQYERHRELAEAVASRDKAVVAKALHAHYRETAQAMVKYLT